MKFTQEELVKAYEQMGRERMEESNTAVKAAEWFQENLLKNGIAHAICRIKGNLTYYKNTPWPITFILELIYQTYGPYKEDYVEVFTKLDYVTLTDDIYEVNTPYGKHRLEFEYFDNHCTGY